MIQAEGKIGSGMFGGGFKNAVERAAEQVARYAVEHFGKSVEGATPRVAEPVKGGSPIAELSETAR